MPPAAGELIRRARRAVAAARPPAEGARWGELCRVVDQIRAPARAQSAGLEPGLREIAEAAIASVDAAQRHGDRSAQCAAAWGRLHHAILQQWPAG